MTIQSVSFKADSAQHKESKKGKYIGAAAGAVVAGGMSSMVYKSLNSDAFRKVHKNLYEQLKDSMPQFKNFEEYFQRYKKNTKVGAVAMSILTIGVGFGIGMWVDSANNKKHSGKEQTPEKFQQKS